MSITQFYIVVKLHCLKFFLTATTLWTVVVFWQIVKFTICLFIVDMATYSAYVFHFQLLIVLLCEQLGLW